jgi:hypothetical protein
LGGVKNAVLLDFMIAIAFILSRHLDNFYTHTGKARRVTVVKMQSWETSLG